VKKGYQFLVATLAVALTVAALWFTNGAVTPKEATRDDVQVEAAQGGYRLISTADVWKRYNENVDRLLLVDTRQNGNTVAAISEEQLTFQ
jgi:hypothetical protein